ncbi:MAG: cysteine desulfurase [Nitrospinae bacterium]|nr:cysteine desulfurase [Nitrospinota bacterium]
MTKTLFNMEKIRADFPMLSVKVRGKPYIYLDNAATTHKPLSVIEGIRRFDSEEYATVRRGAYLLGEKATSMFESVRERVARFINAENPSEIVFTSGTTQSINLVAYSFGRKFIGSGDEVIISHIEHHANILPWQILCSEKDAKLKVIPVADNGELIMEEYEKLLSEKTKIVAVTHASNVLGTIPPVREIVGLAKKVGAKTLIDGAQAAPHIKVDVKGLGCDFYVFSGHKMYGPTGVGVLYGRREVLETMPPYITGGEMIVTVTMEKSTYAKPPMRFEAGTPPVSQVIGLGYAIDYINSIGMDRIQAHEHELLEYATATLGKIPGLTIIGNAREKAALISFTLKNAHPHDVITILDEYGIAVRGGHHCAQPVMQRFGVPATTRASFSFYNKKEEIDALVEGLKKVIVFFS